MRVQRGEFPIAHDLSLSLSVVCVCVRVAPKNGSCSFSRSFFKHAQHTHAAPHAALGRHVEDEHVKDAAQDAAENVSQNVAQDLAFGARVARALLATSEPPPPPSLCSLR